MHTSFTTNLEVTLVTMVAAAIVQAGDLSFYLLEEKPFEGASHLEIPSLGINAWWSGSPILSLSRLDDVKMAPGSIGWSMVDAEGVETERGAYPTQDLTIHLGLKHQTLFKTITTDNLGKRLMMCIGNVPLTAPVIRMPIETPVVMISIRNEDEAKRIFAELTKLVDPKTSEQEAEGGGEQRSAP
jgi:hypothetical protein